MVVVGLAGRAGSGKSAVARRLAERAGVAWVDLDRVAWDVYRPGTPTFAALVERFGEPIVGPDGTIDRTRLAAALADAADHHALEEIVHPAVSRALHTLRARHERDGVRVLLVEGARLASSPHVDRGAFDAIIWLLVPDATRRERLRRACRESHLGRGSEPEPGAALLYVNAEGPVDDVAERVWRALEVQGLVTPWP
ncbi:MAG: dephospho-CoA kinase [Candidatus Bipolaricaulota bacterium]